MDAINPNGDVAWLDMSGYQIEFRIADFVAPAGASAVLLRGQVDLSPKQSEALAEAGFRSFGREGGGFRTMWMREGSAFSPSEKFVEAFPSARKVSWARSRAALPVDGRSPFAPGRQLPSVPRPATRPDPGAASAAPAVTAAPTQQIPDRTPVPNGPPALRAPPRPLQRVVPPQAAAQAPAVQPAPKPASQPAAAASVQTPAPAASVSPKRPAIARPGLSEIGRQDFSEAAPLESGLPEIEFQDDAVEVLHFPAQVNRYQSRYEPQSRIGKPIAMIPINMASAAKAALQRLEEKHGDIDRWISKRAKWTLAQLEQLSPEQVDAVALMMEAIDRDAGAILADQTGLGKGRVLAAVLRICAVEGRTVIFLTEKANLFSDIWRDVRDISSEGVLGTPFILNEKAKIVDTNSAEGTVLFASPKKQDIQKTIASGKLPKGCKMLMATYSQFNRKGSAKTEFLAKVASAKGKGGIRAVAVRDESHNAAGDSNVAAALGVALNGAAVVHSSATFARDGRNMQSYGSILPPSLREADLSALFKVGGMAFAEALSQALVEEGVLIRREHDLSNIRIEVRDDLERIERNRAYADAVSPIFGGLAAVARKVTDLAEERNVENAKLVGSLPAGDKKSAREKWYTMNFGAVLAALVRQVVTAMKVDQCVGECVDLLLRGEKPVVVIETTMEALMRDLARGVMTGEEGPAGAVPDAPPVTGDALEGDVSEESEAAPQPVGALPPDYRDALRLALQRMTELIVKRGMDDPERVQIEDPDVVAVRSGLAAMIELLPDLPLSPIDDIRERVEARSRELLAEGRIEKPWAADEISARSMRVVGGKYETMPPRDRNDVIVGFNGGRTDMVVVTRAGSTGLSLHASERVKDQRKRVMIEQQIPSNVVERVQFWGRVNRRGQVVEPGFLTLSTGLPIEARQLAMQNRKVAQLSANVSANAENATSMDVPDVIDRTGNEICKRILTERPALADRMCIAMRIDEEEAEEELYHVNKLLQRLVLLPAGEQSALYDEVIELYEDAMRELTAQGKHPSQNRELAGVWTVEKRELFDAGNPADGPVFGRPVWSVTVRGERKASPLAAADVERLVAEGSRRLVAAYGEPAEDLGYFARQAGLIRSRLDRLLADALPKGFVSVAAALSSSSPNAVRIRNTALTDLRMLAARARPGAWIAVRDDDGTPSLARVVDVKAPTDDGVHFAGRWTLSYVLPGDEKPREISFSSILRDQAVEVHAEIPKGQAGQVTARFDAAPRGTVVERRTLLDGNLVAAVRIAAEGRLGSAAVWTDEKGVRRRGVLLPKRNMDVSALPGCTFCPEAAFQVMSKAERLESSPSKPSAGIIMRFEGSRDPAQGRVVIEVPLEPKPVADRIRRIFESAGAQFEEGQAVIVARAPAADAKKLLGAYLDSSRCLYFPGRFRKLALSATKLLPKAAGPVPAEAEAGATTMAM